MLLECTGLVSSLDELMEDVLALEGLGPVARHPGWPDISLEDVPGLMERTENIRSVIRLLFEKVGVLCESQLYDSFLFPAFRYYAVPISALFAGAACQGPDPPMSTTQKKKKYFNTVIFLGRRPDATPTSMKGGRLTRRLSRELQAGIHEICWINRWLGGQ